MGSKKIILLATSDINYDQRIQKIAGSLHAMGADVHVLGRALTSSIPLLEKPFTQERLTCIFNQGVLFYLEITIRFFFHLISNSYDIVCANDPDTLLAAIKAKIFKRFDLIYDSHEYFTEVPELQNKGFKKKIWQAIEGNGVKQAKRLYTVNTSLAKILGEKYHREMAVVRNVPLLTPLPEINKAAPYIIYQGALNKGRGLEALIEAMTELPLKLKIAGKGDLSANLQQLVKKLKLEDRVEFVGNLLPLDLKILTQGAWLGINILESYSLNYYYSLANKFFDYMHAEVPSLNMDFPEYKNILAIHKVGLTIKELNPKEIALAINSLLTDKETYELMRANCKTAKTQFNWQKESQLLKEIYGL